MFYRIRDDTTGCEPRKLFNGAPPAVMRPAVVRVGDGVWAGRALHSLAGVTDAVDCVPAQSSSS
jgi:hypothetical protein